MLLSFYDVAWIFVFTTALQTEKLSIRVLASKGSQKKQKIELKDFTLIFSKNMTDSQNIARMTICQYSWICLTLWNKSVGHCNGCSDPEESMFPLVFSSNVFPISCNLAAISTFQPRKCLYPAPQTASQESPH